MIGTALSAEAIHYMETFKKPMIVTEYGADTIDTNTRAKRGWFNSFLNMV